MDRLFSSRALFRTLALFFRYPEEPLNPRLITRHAGVDIKAVIREIRKLEGMGILGARAAGRRRMYRLNRRHPAFPGLRSIFGRARGGRNERGDQVQSLIRGPAGISGQCSARRRAAPE